MVEEEDSRWSRFNLLLVLMSRGHGLKAHAISCQWLQSWSHTRSKQQLQKNKKITSVCLSMQWREQEEIEKQLQNLRKKHHDVHDFNFSSSLSVLSLNNVLCRKISKNLCRKLRKFFFYYSYRWLRKKSGEKHFFPWVIFYSLDNAL